MDLNNLNENLDGNEGLLNTLSGSPEETINYDDIKVPSLDKILEMVQNMPGVSDEEKSSILNEILSGQKGPLGLDEEKTFSQQFFTLFGLLFVVVLIFVLFGYKLYKSLTEKEKKREEKRKLKQMKKKK